MNSKQAPEIFQRRIDELDLEAGFVISKDGLGIQLKIGGIKEGIADPVLLAQIQ